MIESAFEKLLVDLVKNEVRFVTVGGVAVSLNGFVRLTEDVDILVERTNANIQKLLAVVSSFGEGYASELDIGDFSDEPGAIRVIEESIGLQVDIFVQMNNNSYDAFKSNIAKHKLGNGISIPYLDSQGLIELKSTSKREKDQIDVATLKKLSNQ